jgi:hypothetical protein
VGNDPNREWPRLNRERGGAFREWFPEIFFDREWFGNQTGKVTGNPEAHDRPGETGVANAVPDGQSLSMTGAEVTHPALTVPKRNLRVTVAFREPDAHRCHREAVTGGE